MRRTSIYLIVLSIFFIPVAAIGQETLNLKAAERLLESMPACIYPELAKRTRLEEIVKLLVSVSEKGQVIETRVLSGHPILVPSAKECVQQSKYKPYAPEGNAIPFQTAVEIPFFLGLSDKDYEKDRRLAAVYYEKEDQCNALLNASEWQQAEKVCVENLSSAEDLDYFRYRLKMQAYRLAGLALLGQNKHADALEHLKRSLKYGKSKLDKYDLELGDLYLMIGVTYFSMEKPDDAMDYYDDGEKAFQKAYESTKIRAKKELYLQRLKNILERHIQAAETNGKDKDVRKLEERLKSLP